MVIKKLAKELFYKTSFRMLAPKKGNFPQVVLMYHEIADVGNDVEVWTVIKQSEFAKQMEYLKRNFQVIGLEEAVWNFERNKRPAAPAAVVTFDDGYAGNYEFALPVMESLSIPMAVFVATGAVQQQVPYWYDRLILALQKSNNAKITIDGLLINCRINECAGERKSAEIYKLLNTFKRIDPDKRENMINRLLEKMGQRDNGQHQRPMAPLPLQRLKELARSPLVTLGAHTHHHDILTQLSEREIRETIKKSKELLEGWTGREIRFFAYPNGDYNASVIKILREEGFKCGLTTTARRWSFADSLFEIPRIGIGRYDSLPCFRYRLAKTSMGTM